MLHTDQYMIMPSIISQNISLASLTTLGVGGNADFFASVCTLDELREVILWAKTESHPVTILGGGSNVLVSEDGVRGLVVHPAFLEIAYEYLDTDVLVTVGAGVELDVLIEKLVEKELWGLENLSAIPGTVGAVPVQNVGAYGVEAKDLIMQVIVYDSERNSMRAFSNEECAFGYRDSIFKKSEGSTLIISSVIFRLHKTPSPSIAYRDVREYFGTNLTPSLSEIRNAIIDIRSKKLPDWRVVGTAGSFFKNPIVHKDVYASLLNKYPLLPGFPEADGRIKIPLGWVLDNVCNLRGYREGNVWLHEKQALVLVCEKTATEKEVTQFAQKIISIVFEKTGMKIEQEVRTLK